MRTLHSGSKKNAAQGIRVILAYTKFQQCQCITFEDMKTYIFGAQILQFLLPQTPH